MNAPIYIPIFRLREQEKGVLNTFNFGTNIYPYIEIFKKQPRKDPEPRENSIPKKKEPKKFHEHYLPVINKINCEKVFVDLPTHLKRTRKMNKEVIEFLTTVVEKRQIRTEHMLSLSSCTKIIPVISTYSQIGIGEENSIPLQVNDLRSTFQTIAFRTSELTFASDLVQINSVAQPQDFLFIDLGELCLSNQDDLDTIDYLVAKLKTFDKCSVVFINSPIVHTTTNSGLDHGKKIAGTNNDLMNKFSSYGAHCFADYSGIKKDLVEEGRGISPGFIFYDAIGNEFYGYKGRKWKKPEKPDLDDFREIIIRDLLTSEVVAHLKSSHLLYLCSANKGWKMINDMWDRTEKWKSQAKFKRISMEHYLHCIKTKIEAGYFQV